MQVKVQNEKRVVLALTEREAAVLNTMMIQGFTWSGDTEVARLAESIHDGLRDVEVDAADDVSIDFNEANGMMEQRS